MEKIKCEHIICYVKEEYKEFFEDIALPYTFVEVKDLSFNLS